MKQKVMISAGSQCFEFEGEIVEIENDYLILKAKHGDIYIERKFLVFIQYLNEEEAGLPKPAHISCPWCFTRHIDVGEWETRPHHKHLCLTCKKMFRVEGEHGEYFYGIPGDEQAYPKQSLPSPKAPKTDAVAKFINAQLKHDPVDEILQAKFVPPSQLPDEGAYEGYENPFGDEDEVSKNVYGAVHGETPVTKTGNLKDAVKAAMGTDVDLTMGMSGGKYKSPAQTILGMKSRK